MTRPAWLRALLVLLLLAPGAAVGQSECPIKETASSGTWSVCSTLPTTLDYVENLSAPSPITLDQAREICSLRAQGCLPSARLGGETAGETAGRRGLRGRRR